MPVDKIRNPVWSRRAYSLRSWALTVGPGMVVGGVFAVTLALSYMRRFGAYKQVIHPLEMWVPWWVWAVLWLAAGIAMVGTGAVAPKSRAANFAFTAWSVMMFIWGSSWLMSWWSGDTERGVAFATLYCAFPSILAWSRWVIGKIKSDMVKAVPNGY